MGFIYKITNKLNQKLYIGQTRNSIHRRWLDHCKSARNEQDKDHNAPLHLAINKYGEQNFIIEKIEECENSKLNEREIFWINHYNSFKNGYNAALGGLGHTKYDYDEIVNYYLLNGCSITKTCQHFQVYDQVVYTALNSKNINYKELSKRALGIKPVKSYIVLVEKNLVFKSMADIDIYLKKTAHPNIRRCLNGITEKAYGYHWKEIPKTDTLDEGLMFYDFYNK